jgi:hypothetical protein
LGTVMTRALARIEQVSMGTMDIIPPHICQEMPPILKSQGGSRDQASEEEAHQEEETNIILDRCRRLAEAESE